MYLCDLGKLPASRAQLSFLHSAWTLSGHGCPWLMRKEVQECLLNIPHWSALREGSFYRRRYPTTTTGFLHSHLTPSEASPIKVGSKERRMDSATQAWDQGTEDSRYHKIAQSTRRAICVTYAGNAASSKGALWVKLEIHTELKVGLPWPCATIPPGATSIK